MFLKRDVKEKYGGTESESREENAVESAAEKTVSLADDRTELALKRTILANKRTYLAWIRTVLSLMAFGFVLEKLEVYLTKIHAPTPGLLETGLLATACFALSSVIVILAWIKMVINYRSITGGGFPWNETLLFVAVLLVAVFFFAVNKAYVPL